jgi:hypothetical protein
MSYVPRAGSVAARLVEHLSADGAPESMTGSEIAKLFGFDVKQISTRLAAAVGAGVIVREQIGMGYVYRLPKDDAPAAVDFEACIWDNGELYLFGLDAINVNGMPGVRLTHEQAEHVERLLRARAQG